jgi:hypothetical protein
MMMRRHRTSSAILIAALMFAITLYPQVTADSFYEKLLRGVRLNTGADLAVILDSTELLGQEPKVEPIRDHLIKLSPKAGRAAETIRRVSGVRGASVMYEMQVPGDYYLPGGMTNLPVYIVPDRGAYLSTAYYEAPLGVEQRFDAAVSGTTDGIVVSKGLADFEDVSLGDALLIGDGARGEVEDQVNGIVALLPGAPQVMLQSWSRRPTGREFCRSRRAPRGPSSWWMPRTACRTWIWRAGPATRWRRSVSGRPRSRAFAARSAVSDGTCSCRSGSRTSAST